MAPSIDSLSVSLYVLAVIVNVSMIILRRPKHISVKEFICETVLVLNNFESYSSACYSNLALRKI